MRLWKPFIFSYYNFFILSSICIQSKIWIYAARLLKQSWKRRVGRNWKLVMISFVLPVRWLLYLSIVSLNKTRQKQKYSNMWTRLFSHILFCLSQWINHWYLHNRTNLLCTFLLLLKLCDNLQNPMAESAVNCDNIVNMPSISFIIGNRSFHLTPEQVWESNWKKKKKNYVVSNGNFSFCFFLCFALYDPVCP